MTGTEEMKGKESDSVQTATTAGSREPTLLTLQESGPTSPADGAAGASAACAVGTVLSQQGPRLALA